MKIWIDAHISPAISKWIQERFSIEAYALRDLGLRDADDELIYQRAKIEQVAFITKDEDFVSLYEQNGSPPKVIWLTCGNTSNKELKRILEAHLENVCQLLESGEEFVEISSM